MPTKIVKDFQTFHDPRTTRPWLPREIQLILGWFISLRDSQLRDIPFSVKLSYVVAMYVIVYSLKVLKSD
jgi:hypothetical protein